MSVINSGRFITIKGDKDEVNRLNSMQRAVDLKKESKVGITKCRVTVSYQQRKQRNNRWPYFHNAVNLGTLAAKGGNQSD